jgi:hypothetical protein
LTAIPFAPGELEELLKGGPYSSIVIEGIGLSGSFSQAYLSNGLMVFVDRRQLCRIGVFYQNNKILSGER